jgi:hypothetical protein
VVWLRCPSGSAYPFEKDAFPAEQVALKDQFGLRPCEGEVWAVPLDGDAAPEGKVYTRHYCSAYAEHLLMRNVESVEPLIERLFPADALF